MVATDEHRRRIAQSRDGDHGAFEALIREHQRMIYSLCDRMSGSQADAEDLAQETFIHACQHLDGFRAEARFSSWLYRIAVNQCLNWQKQKQRVNRLYKEWSEQSLEPHGDDPGRAHQIQEALSPPLYLKICGPRDCQRFVTFSGQQIRVNGDVCDVLSDHQGNVLVVGRQLLLSGSKASTRGGQYQIEAGALEDRS
jgi:RNA polymerase sigma factor (sigma-70 family)